MQINKGAFEKKKAQEHRPTAKQTRIENCCPFFPALLRKLLCILCKVARKDVGNFVFEITLNGNRPRQQYHGTVSDLWEKTSEFTTWNYFLVSV